MSIDSSEMTKAPTGMQRARQKQVASEKCGPPRLSIGFEPDDTSGNPDFKSGYPDTKSGYPDAESGFPDTISGYPD